MPISVCCAALLDGKATCVPDEHDPLPAEVIAAPAVAGTQIDTDEAAWATPAESEKNDTPASARQRERRKPMLITTTFQRESSPRAWNSVRDTTTATSPPAGELPGSRTLPRQTALVRTMLPRPSRSPAGAQGWPDASSTVSIGPHSGKDGQGCHEMTRMQP